MDTKDYRQVVSDMSITSSKSFNDFVYGWLVLNSICEDEERFVWKRSFVFSKMEQEFQMTRKTLAKYFDYLLEVGLVADGGDKWVITDLGKEGFWIAVDILERLVLMRQRYVISIYVYLVKGYWVAGKTRLVVLLDNVKNYLGLATNSRSNSHIITEIFENFREMGLLNCQLNFDQSNVKRYYVLTGIGKSNYF